MSKRRFKKKDKIATKRKIHQKLSQKYGRCLRYNPTHAEIVLKDCLWKNCVDFQFQKEFFTTDRCYIVDFFFRRENNSPLVVEVDGSSHSSLEALQHDAERTLWLRQHRNCEVIRFMNEEVLANAQGIVDKIISLGIRKFDPVQNFIEATNGNWLA
jgi:very-short-patch-repair endonuclease